MANWSKHGADITRAAGFVIRTAGSLCELAGLTFICDDNVLQVRESVWGGEQESSSEEGGGGEGIWDTQAMEVKGQLISAPGENKC